MSWFTDIVARLKADSTLSALVSTRVYPQVAPASAGSPIADTVVLTRTSNDPVDSHDGASGLAAEMLQVTCLSSTHLGAQAIADAVRGSLDGTDGTIGSTTGCRFRRLNERDVPDLTPDDQERQIYGVQQDYQCWHQE